MCLLAAQSFLPNAALAVLGVIGAIAMLFWLWMAVDCLVNEPQATQKSGWLLAIVFGSWIGALFYYFIRRRERLNSSRTGTLPAVPTQSAGARQQFGSAGVAMDAEVISASHVPPLAAASAVARPSDWTLLRVLLVVVGVLIVLPALLGVVAYVVMLAVLFSSARQDQQSLPAPQPTANANYEQFQKQAAERQKEIQKRAAERAADFAKRAAQQDADFQKRVAEQEEEFKKRFAEIEAAQKNFFERENKVP